MFEVFSQYFEARETENRGMGKGTGTHTPEDNRKNFIDPCMGKFATGNTVLLSDELNKLSLFRNGSEIFPPGRGAVLQNPGIHH